jgi:hypothetical protein
MTGRVSDDLTRLFDVLVTLPDRLFDGDLMRCGERIGVSPLEATLMRRLSDGCPPLYGRGDLYRVQSSFKLLELDIGGRLGGIGLAELSRGLLAVPSFNEFAERHRLGFVDTLAELAHALRAAADTIGRGEAPVSALLEADGGLSPHIAGYASIAGKLTALGLDLRLGELGQIRARESELLLGDTRVDVVLRFFSANQILGDQHAEQAVETLLRAQERRAVVVFTPLESYLYANKATLALLSDPEFDAAFSAEERSLIDSFLPWTRSLAADQVRTGRDTVDLFDYCRTHRGDLILKPAARSGGDGIIPGWELDDREWHEALSASRHSGFIVQQRVIPTPDLVVDPNTGELQEWRTTWGIYVTGHGYAGTVIRAVPQGERAVVSYAGTERTQDLRDDGMTDSVPHRRQFASEVSR